MRVYNRGQQIITSERFHFREHISGVLCEMCDRKRPVMYLCQEAFCETPVSLFWSCAVCLRKVTGSMEVATAR